MLKRLVRCLKHRWLDASDVRRQFPGNFAKNLEKQIESAETLHHGEVRICVEAGLPLRSLWQHMWHTIAMPLLVRQRARSLFGKLNIWDTSANSGVLIYLLLAERAIEIVADRGLNDKVSVAQWQSIIQALAEPLAKGEFESGLKDALFQVNRLLTQHFAREVGDADVQELSNAIVFL